MQLKNHDPNSTDYSLNGTMDAIPVFSQAKSFVQWICGDAKGAEQTQINFSRQCPVVSQLRSAVEAASGNPAAAQQTQIEFGNFVLALVSGIPVVGHVKGAVHYALKDKEKGDACMKAASHTSAVIGGGVGGFLVGGPVGAVAGGIAAGGTIDFTISAADSAISETFTPYGVFEPLADPRNPGKWCDVAGGVILDGVTGRCAGKIVQKIQISNMAKNSGVVNTVVETVIQDKVIPKPLIFVWNQVKLMVKVNGEKLFFSVIKAGKQHLENRPLNVPLYDAENCKLDMNNEDIGSAENASERSGVSFKLNGDVLEAYYQGKLILVKNGNLKYIANGGGMEQIKDKVEYCLCANGRFIARNELEEKRDAALEMQSNSSVYEDASDAWIDRNTEKFVYDPVLNMILSDPYEHPVSQEEERQGILIPVNKPVVQNL